LNVSVCLRSRNNNTRAAAAFRPPDYDDDGRLLNAAQAGGDEVSADIDISGAKFDLELELERPPLACVSCRHGDSITRKTLRVCTNNI
jgi:hypothetical protein